MNRTEYMQKVYATSLDQVSKTILVYLGFCKNWKRDTLAFPSHARIAADTGLGARTVKRKVPELRARGYLRDTGRRVGRGVIVYDLNDPTSATEAPQERHGGTGQCQSGTAGAPQRHTEQVREPVREPVLEQVHTAPVVADAPTVTVDSDSSLQGEGRDEALPSMGSVWVSRTGDVLFEADTGSGVYMLSDGGVSALSLPETRTAAPVADEFPPERVEQIRAEVATHVGPQSWDDWPQAISDAVLALVLDPKFASLNRDELRIGQAYDRVSRGMAVRRT